MFRVLIGLVVLGCLQSSAVAQPRSLKKSPQSTAVEGWGQFENRRQDCQIKPEPGRLTITVPGTPHNLNREISDLSAPRVLRDVEGDFSIQVEVSGDFNPHPFSTVYPKGKAYNGAGLLLWVNEDLFVRLERNIWIQAPGVANCHPPLFEVMVKGAPTGTSPGSVPANFFSSSATWFRLSRSGNTVSGALSHDGVSWVACGTHTLALPAKVSVGVAAVNTSRKPFRAEFEELDLKTGADIPKPLPLPAQPGPRTQPGPGIAPAKPGVGL